MIALLALLVTAACTPVVIPAGPVVTAPALAGDAVIAADGARLPLRRFEPDGPPRAVMLALHGFNDHAGNFLLDSQAAFARAGILIYAYDQRGFGRAPNRGYWPGAETLAADAVQAARLLRARHPDLPFFLLGESMGASVAILAATADPPPPVDAYILMAPALWQKALLSGFTRGMMRVFERTIPALPLTGGIGGVVASDNEGALQRLGRDPLVIRNTRVDAVLGLVDLMDAAVAALPRCCRGAGGAQVPALLLYGENDMLVPGAMTRAAIRSLPPDSQVRMGVYPDGYHLLLAGRTRAEVARDIVAFLENSATTLPSGAEENAPRWINR